MFYGYCERCRGILNQFNVCARCSMGLSPPFEIGERFNTQHHVQPPRVSKQILLPFEPWLKMVPNGEGDICAFTQVSCRPLRLYFPHEIAHHLLVLDIQVGKQSFFANCGSMLGSAFCERRNPRKSDRLLDWPVFGMSERIRVKVRNEHNVAMDIRAYLTVMVEQ